MATPQWQWYATASTANSTIYGYVQNPSSWGTSTMPVNNFPWQYEVTQGDGWYTTSGTGTSTHLAWHQWNNEWQETKRQRHDRLRAVRRQREEQAERQRQAEEEFVARRARAEALLAAHMTDEQRRMWEEERRMIVHSNKGRRFEIRRGTTMGNVCLLNSRGCPTRRYCCHPIGVPDADAFLTQKLAIETDEDYFVRLANVHAL